jgi:hypothetical protein
VPLETALSTLRDKNDDIKLEVPISGDIDDPKFDISDAIEQAVVKGMKFSALSFLKYALQPYGALIAVGQYAVEEGAAALTGVQLDPVFFAPGARTLDDEALDYLERIAELAKGRPELRIKICGKATSADKTALGGKPPQTPKAADKPSSDSGSHGSGQKLKLRALAKGRAAAIKEHLVKNLGIEPDRLFVCFPEIDEDPEARPRADLLI